MGEALPAAVDRKRFMVTLLGVTQLHYSDKTLANFRTLEGFTKSKAVFHFSFTRLVK
jgi:hypothetical protein